jgi:GT2 family glycosyltransferase
MAGEPLVCAIIINYNGRDLLERFLATFGMTDYPNYRLVVVDNGSTDGSMETFGQDHPAIDLLSLKPNLGFSGGNNAGMRHAVAKYDPAYVLLLNNDMEVLEPGWLTELVRAAESEPGAGAVGCKLLMPGGLIQHAGGRFSPSLVAYHPFENTVDDHSHDGIHDSDFVTGACLLIKREVLEKVGLLDQGFNPIYFEDCDYCARVRRAGYRVIYDGKASLQHYNPRAPRKNFSLEDRKYGGWNSNRIRFVLLDLPFYWWPLILPRIFLGAFAGRDESGRLRIARTFPRRLMLVLGGLAKALLHRAPQDAGLARK